MTDAHADVREAMASSAEALNAVFGDAAPGTLFSEPIQAGEDLVITAVAWERAGGFGYGSGSGQDTGEDSESTGSGSGIGGGGASQGRPVAVIRITPRGVEVSPVIDFTKIGLTLLLGILGAWRALRR